MRNVLIVGGGAAGLSAAVAAAENGARVTLLERNEKLGKKIYITGKGRCNLTNACGDTDAFLRNVPHNPRFLYSALDALSPDALRQKLEAWDCPTVVERGDRVFPQSQKASDVTRAFERELRRLGVSVRLNARVRALSTAPGADGLKRVSGVTLESGETLGADAAILCTGGRSYPSTGSTGDGYTLLESLGHTVHPARPALVALVCGARWVTDLQGLSLKNVRLTLTRGKKTLFAEQGEMLFTHFGVSGPLVLSASSYWQEGCALALDLKPALSLAQLDERVQRDVREASRKELGTLLRGLFPARLAESMAALCGLDPRKPACELTREEREALCVRAKALVLPVSGPASLAEAIVTRGGAEVREVDPHTLQSKLVPGLYVCGELLDVDALTGGFNLHIAFSTGFLAGASAAREEGLE